MNENGKTKIQIKLLYFAKVKELLNNKAYDLVSLDTADENNQYTEFKVSDIFDLVKSYNKKFSEELKLIFPTCLIALNDEYIQTSPNQLIKIKDNDEIAILPPISAG